jgi:hypothetical protein
MPLRTPDALRIKAMRAVLPRWFNEAAQLSAYALQVRCMEEAKRKTMRSVQGQTSCNCRHANQVNLFALRSWRDTSAPYVLRRVLARGE